MQHRKIFGNRVISVLLQCTILLTTLCACGSGQAPVQKQQAAGTEEAAGQASTEMEAEDMAGQTSAGIAAVPGGDENIGRNPDEVPAEGNTGQTSAGMAAKDTTGQTSAEMAAVTDGDEDIEKILDGMSLEEKVGQMMIVSFRSMEETPGTAGGRRSIENPEEVSTVNITELNEEIRDCLKKYHFGGTLLFAENFVDPEQVLRLVSDIQAENQEGGGLPLIVSCDQEGGFITRMKFGTIGVGNMALAATGDPDNAKKMASVYGEEMGLLGINADLAPVVDINNNPANPVIGIRSFSDDPDMVSEYGLHYLDGLHEAGTMVSLKHFPGHGDTDTDSHTGFPCIHKSYEELKDFELIPFQKAIDAGADMVMTAHIQYPEIEDTTYISVSTGEQVYLPATMSRTIMTDILRDDMGFEGVCISDALDMAAITDHFSDEDVLTLTINAGVDLLILPCIYNRGLLEKTKELTDKAVELAEDGKIDMECIDKAVRRILTLKKKYDLLDDKDFTVTEEQVSAAVNGIRTEEHRKNEWEMAQQALTVLKNENGAFPAAMEAGQKAVILFSDNSASRAASGELARQILEENHFVPDKAEISIMVNTADNEEECVQAAVDADPLVLVYRTYSSGCLDPASEDGFSSAVFDRVIEERHAAGKKTILISAQLPYDAARFPEADAILLTYGSSIMRELPPASGADSGYMPNLPAAICACFGMGEAGGQVPVKIPELDENYHLIMP